MSAKLTPIGFANAAKNWIGTPFADGMKVKGLGCDCAGLIEGMLLEFGQAIPNRKSLSLIDGLRYSFDEVSLNDLGVGDVIVFKNLSTSNDYHCAVLIEDNRIIHAHWSKGVVFNTYGNWFRARAVYAFKIKGQSKND